MRLDALGRDWDRAYIRDHAARNTWDSRVQMLLDELRALHAGPVDPQTRRACGA